MSPRVNLYQVGFSAWWCMIINYDQVVMEWNINLVNDMYSLQWCIWLASSSASSPTSGSWASPSPPSWWSPAPSTSFGGRPETCAGRSWSRHKLKIQASFPYTIFSGFGAETLLIMGLWHSLAALHTTSVCVFITTVGIGYCDYLRTWPK